MSWHIRVTDVLAFVNYELGYAHGRGKEVILIARQGSTIHFDIKDYNIIFYRNFTELEERITKRIAAIKKKAEWARQPIGLGTCRGRFDQAWKFIF